MIRILAITVTTVFLAMLGALQASDAIPPATPRSAPAPTLTYRPAPAPPQVSQAAALLTEACRRWEPISVPVTAGEAPAMQVTLTSNELSILCSVAESPAMVDRCRDSIFWIGSAFGAIALGIVLLLCRLIRSVCALVRTALSKPVTS